MSCKKQRVVVVGASSNPARYSNRAVCLLMQHGHEVVPVSPAAQTIEGLTVHNALAEVDGPVDTITLYVSPKVSSELAAAIEHLKPLRVIFNPGAENPDLRDSLIKQGIYTKEACTLVLLNSQQF